MFSPPSPRLNSLADQGSWIQRQGSYSNYKLWRSEDWRLHKQTLLMASRRRKRFSAICNGHKSEQSEYDFSIQACLFYSLETMELTSAKCNQWTGKEEISYTIQNCFSADTCTCRLLIFISPTLFLWKIYIQALWLARIADQNFYD